MSQRAASLAGLDVSKGVRDFYDHFPYPPPLDNLTKYKRRWEDRERRRADFHLLWPGRAYDEHQTVLIAGCGTSQAAKHALRWPAAEVIGIDCSETSVRHTERLKKTHDIGNLQVHRLAIEEVAELGMSFDRIVCTGVLHHLADPSAALRNLRSALKPNGAMVLMVYAPYGRADVYMLQEFCRRVGVHSCQEEIRNLITALPALPKRHPLEALLAESPELRNELALADSLLNPRDRPYSVSQLFELVEGAEMTFGRWLRQAPYNAFCGVMAMIPQSGQIARLPLKEQYAVAELFRGTMARHSTVVYRNDCVNSMHRIDFEGDKWLYYVPIRMADTLCVQEDVRDAAAVLINRTHTYRDLFLPIEAREKQLFDAINGQSTIGEIAEKAKLATATEAEFYLAREFFERLWSYDQVVFDTSVRH